MALKRGSLRTDCGEIMRLLASQLLTDLAERLSTSASLTVPRFDRFSVVTIISIVMDVPV